MFNNFIYVNACCLIKIGKYIFSPLIPLLENTFEKFYNDFFSFSARKYDSVTTTITFHMFFHSKKFFCRLGTLLQITILLFTCCYVVSKIILYFFIQKHAKKTTLLNIKSFSQDYFCCK